jgi:alpha-maltose-1-phosphate synthase
MPDQPRVLLAHPGTQYSHRLAEQLAQHGALYEFWTGFALANEAYSTWLLRQCLPLSWQRKISNRVLIGVPSRRLRTTPFIEWKALRKIQRGESPQRVLHRRNQAFQRGIPTRSLKSASAIIGFDTSSWLIAKRAQVLNKPFFLDQSISHPASNESILKKVGSRFPDWRNDIESRPPEVLACENQEHRLATKIVVASLFTKRTLVLNGVDPEKIIVNPYGVNLQLFHPSSVPRLQRELRFLFLGSISARKGVPLLLEAWKNLASKDAELWIVGPINEQARVLIPPLSNLRIMGSYPHRELPKLLRQCDVLVFPSYCEGFGLVLLEALASGLPIITTDATAGPDLIKDGVEGRLIPAGNLEALCEAMTTIISHRDELERMSIAARRRAEGFSWDDYGARWQKLLTEHAQ